MSSRNFLESSAPLPCVGRLETFRQRPFSSSMPSLVGNSLGTKLTLWCVISRGVRYAGQAHRQDNGGQLSEGRTQRGSGGMKTLIGTGVYLHELQQTESGKKHAWHDYERKFSKTIGVIYIDTKQNIYISFHFRLGCYQRKKRKYAG